MRNHLSRYVLGVIRRAFAMLLCVSFPMHAQQTEVQPPSQTATSPELQSKVADLDENLRATREELAQSREEIRQLRSILEKVEEQLTALTPANAAAQSGTQAPAEQISDRVAAVEEQQAMLQSQIAQAEQKKVETASKYPIRLTGLILMNAAYTRGTVDSIDVPQLAFSRPANASGGSISATFRQTILGVEANGPTLWGAKSSANVYADFFGGFPNADFGVNAGLVRLRTARIRLDWANTSLVAGQESPFFSPLSPTSLATLGLPALAWAGNLWAWTPQIRVERTMRFSGGSSVLLQGGVVDPIDYEVPISQSFRKASPGEQSRQPGYATRFAWSYPAKEDNPLSIGIGGFFSPQRYSFDRRVDAWAATTDMQVPLGRKFEFSGELYRGKAVGGLGGGQFNSTVSNGNLALASTSIAGLNSVGAWGQLKYRASSRLEFNGAIGHDNPFASDLERFPSNLNPTFARNQTSFVNCIFTPEESLLLSLELRHIQSYPITGRGNTADQLNLALGYKF
jgi:hypothetical protein